LFHSKKYEDRFSPGTLSIYLKPSKTTEDFAMRRETIILLIAVAISFPAFAVAENEKDFEVQTAENLITRLGGLPSVLPLG